MKTLFLRAVLALFLCSCLVPASGADYRSSPCDSAATDATKNLYRYLASRRGLTTDNMIEGQHLGGVSEVHADENNGNTPPLQFDILNHAIDGRLPAMVGSRYDAVDTTQQGDPYVLDPALCTQINNRLISYWNTYQPIVHITAIPRNPWMQSLGRAPYQTGNNLSELLDPDLPSLPGSPHRNFWDDIDTIAAALQQFATQGIPVVFRPFAEFNQSNKYYYANQQPAVFNQLWREVFQYYTARKGLHNLLFCWEVWALNCGNTAANIAPWYPGSDYVDVVAGAYYFLYNISYVDGNGQFYFPKVNDQSIYDFLIAQDRPFGAAQFGVNYQEPNRAPGDNNLTRLFMTYSPDLAFAYYWKGYMEVNSQDHASEFVADQRVATCDDLPDLENSVATVTLGNLEHVYDGTPKSATATTAPAGLTVTFTYDGSGTPPTNVGSYAVIATVADPYYTGTASGTLTIAAPPPTTVTFTSIAVEDGRIIESGETTDEGGSSDTGASGNSALRVGDEANVNGNERQYRSIVSFDTSTIPPNATILSATLRLKRGAVSGTNPFLTHGPCYVDVSSGGFGGDPALIATDFQAEATAQEAATMSNPVANGDLSTGTLGALGIAAINRSGRTQFRLYFATDDNDDEGTDYLGFYSANHANASNHPVLEVTYQ